MATQDSDLDLRAQLEELKRQRAELDQQESELAGQEAETMAPVEPEPKERGYGELAGRALRSAIAGHTLYASEPIIGGLSAVIDRAKELAGEEDFQGFDKEYDIAKQKIADSVKEQTKFEEEYPGVAITAGIAGGLVPSPINIGSKLAGAVMGAGKAAQVAGTAIKEAEKFSVKKAAAALAKKGLQASAVGASGSAAQQTFKEMGAAGGKEFAPVEAAKRVGEAAAIGSVAGPVVAAGLGGVAAGVKGAAKIPALIGTSKPVLRMIQLATGRTVDEQQRFMQFERELEALPDNEKVVQFLESLRTKILDDLDNQRLTEEEAASTLKSLESGLAESKAKVSDEIKQRKFEIGQGLKKIASDIDARMPKAQEAAVQAEEAIDAQTANVKRQLGVTQEDIQQQLAEVKPLAAASVEQSVAQKFETPDFSYGQKLLDDADKALKEKISTLSTEAVEKLNPEFTIDKDAFIDVLEDHARNLAVPGTGRTVGPEAKRAAQGIKALILDIKKLGLGDDTQIGQAAKEANQSVADYVEANWRKAGTALNSQQVKSVIRNLDLTWDEINRFAFGEKVGNAIKAARFKVNQLLVAGNKEYDEAMQPVRQLMELQERLAAEFGGSKRAGAVGKALADAQDSEVAAKALLDLEAATGVPVTEPMRKMEDIGKKTGFAKLAIQKSDPFYEEVVNLEKQLKLLNTDDVNQPFFDSIRDLPTSKKIIALRSELEKRQNPAYIRELKAKEEAFKELERLRQLRQLTASDNLDTVILQRFGDDPIAQQLISFKDELRGLIEPQLLQAKIERAVATGEMSVQDAATRLKGITSKRRELERLAMRFGFERGEQGIKTILKDVASPVETVAATKMINAITELPPDAFGEIFKLINLSDPQDFAKMSELLRLQRAMSVVRPRGSARVAGIGGLMARAIESVMRVKMPTPVTAALGSYAALFAEEFGPMMTQKYLRNMSRLKGLPTFKKISGASPSPLNQRLQTALMIQLQEYVSGNPQEALEVADAMIPDLIQDVKASELSNLEKAKAITQLNKSKRMQFGTVRKLIAEGMPSSSQAAEISSRLIEAPENEDLRADNPKVLKFLEGKEPVATPRGRQLEEFIKGSAAIQ